MLQSPCRAGENAQNSPPYTLHTVGGARFFFNYIIPRIPYIIFLFDLYMIKNVHHRQTSYHIIILDNNPLVTNSEPSYFRILMDVRALFRNKEVF